MEKQRHDWRHQTKLLTTPLQHPSLNIHPTCWSSRWVIINALQSAPVWHCKGCFKSLLRKSTSHARSQRSRDPSRSLHFDAPTCLVNKIISFVKFCKAPNSLLHVTTVLSIRIFRNFCLTRGVQPGVAVWLPPGSKPSAFNCSKTALAPSASCPHATMRAL